MAALFPVTIADLGALTLIGEAGIEGMDVVVLYTEPGGGSGAQIDASGQESVLGLEAYWTAAEFNVFGAGNTSAAIFNADNSGATIVVQLSINDGTVTPPTCIQEGFTGETNSLTLMPEAIWPELSTCLPFYGENAGGTALPSIEFLESNGPYNGISVTADLPSSVTGSSAVLNGSVNPHGSEALAWFEYNTNGTPSCSQPQTANPGTVYVPAAFNIGSGGDYVPISTTIVGLSPSTTYYYWACALGALYQANSNVESFVTPPLAPPPTPYVFGSGPGPDVIWEEPTVGWAQVWYLACVPDEPCYPPAGGAADVTQANPWNIVGIGDFNGDGAPDIVWQDPVSGAVQVWYLGGPQGVTLIGAADITTKNPWRVVSVADFNQDGHPDLLWQDPVNGFSQIWYLGGPQGTTLIGAADLDVTNPWKIVGTGDFNNDGFPDVLWQDPVSGTVQIWYMGGNTPGSQGSVLQYAINLTGAMTTKV
ncbi:MAG: VCBS repeat-containing protein, partial [Bryobacteraceae bacterium]